MTLQDLPLLNAILNGTAAVLLVTGFILIKQGNRQAHKKVMLAAFTTSILFLICYLVYHYYRVYYLHIGVTRYAHTGPIRTFYYALLISHTSLAALVPFLAIAALRRGLKGQFERHKKIAKWTLPIWLYVSITGVVVYLMLYQF
jgi:protein SCO1/2/putative membrane protein